MSGNQTMEADNKEPTQEEPNGAGPFINGRGKSRSVGKALTDRLSRSSTFTLERTDTMLKLGKLKLRGKTDDLPQWVVLVLVLSSLNFATYSRRHLGPLSGKGLRSVK